VYLGESLVTHVNDDKLPSSEVLLFHCTFNVPLCRNFLHVKVLCEKFFVAFHFVSCLSCSKLTCFAFPCCSGVDLCVIVSFFLHVEVLLCWSFSNIFAWFFLSHLELAHFFLAMKAIFFSICLYNEAQFVLKCSICHSFVPFFWHAKVTFNVLNFLSFHLLYIILFTN